MFLDYMSGYFDPDIHLVTSVHGLGIDKIQDAKEETREKEKVVP